MMVAAVPQMIQNQVGVCPGLRGVLLLHVRTVTGRGGCRLPRSRAAPAPGYLGA